MSDLSTIASITVIACAGFLVFDQATLKQRIRRIVREEISILRDGIDERQATADVVAIWRYHELQREIEEKIAASQRPTPEPERSVA